ncbi:MAG: glycosyltransferase family 2 protein [Candidatus Omnitrophica bacterium]|nr:glycosyltransferase family 2 protein [Candidatus Omnitrophota bacterium]
MANSDKLVSIIIVTFGSKDYLRGCLDSVKRQSYPLTEVIVIDNSLDADFSAGMSGLFPFIKLYTSPRNLYYGPSLNKGIQLSSGEYILCLNDDVSLDKEFIGEAIRGFSIKDSIGMVSGKILRPDGSTLDSTGLFLTVWRTAKERGYGKPDRGQFEDAGFIFGVSGSLAFYRKSMLEDIRRDGNYFDPRFRMFYEDLDISWRAHKRAWQAYYIPQAKAFHVRGGSWRPDSGLGKPICRRYLDDRLHSELIKNRYLSILKNESFFGLLAHLLPIALYDLCAWAYVFLFRRNVIKIFLNRRNIFQPDL